MRHDHAALGWALFECAALVALAAAAVGYAAALRASAGRGRWPAYRTVLWYAGLLCAGTGLVGPLPAAAHTGFTAHMVGHLLVGMLAPLLLVPAAPVTLLLRALPAPPARSLTRLLRTPPVRVAAHPVVAALLNAGGLWVLYTGGLYPLMHASAPVHAAVHVHVLVAGYVLTASLVGVDPNPHRAPFRTRSVVLVTFVAAHSVLAKWLYAHPPTGVEAADARTGAQLMYYGGDAVDVLLIVLLFAQRHAAARPRGAAPGLRP